MAPTEHPVIPVSLFFPGDEFLTGAHEVGELLVVELERVLPKLLHDAIKQLEVVS